MGVSADVVSMSGPPEIGLRAEKLTCLIKRKKRELHSWDLYRLPTLFALVDYLKNTQYDKGHRKYHG